MTCKPDLSKLISEIEWLVKNHSRRTLEPDERLKPSTNGMTACKDQCYPMKITLDIFVRLHQMLQNYIDLVNFHGPKSRDFGCLKIPLNEALDVAVRAMISSMQSATLEHPYSTSICLNCTRNSEYGRDQPFNLRNSCDFENLPEIEEVDKKLQRLKVVSLEKVENVEKFIRDILHAIAKLPLTVMTSRLEILSSMVRNTKNKLTSCGRSGAASLMGTQVNPISQIISEFISEYGQIKSKIFPCRKICRFCNSVICPVDRQRNNFCCENARQLNSLWKEWIQRNSLKGFAQWDEDTLMSIVDSVKDTPAEGKKCVPGGPCASFCGTAGQRPGQDGEGDGEQNRGGVPGKREEQSKKMSSNLSGGEVQSVDNRREHRGLQEKKVRRNEGSELRSRIGGSRSSEKRNSKDPGKKEHYAESRSQDAKKDSGTKGHSAASQNQGKEKDPGKKRHFAASQNQDKERDPGKKGHLGASQNQDKGKDSGNNLQGSNRKNAGGSGVGKTMNSVETSRKKGIKKDAGGVDPYDQDVSPSAGDREKITTSRKRDPKKTEGDLNPENKRRGKSNRKKEGEFLDHSGDQGIGNPDEPGSVKSAKKGRDAKNGMKGDMDGQISNTVNSSSAERDSRKNEIGKENGTTKSGGLEKGGHSGKSDDGESPGILSGTRTREKYIQAMEEHGKRSSGKEQEVKSGNGTPGASENLIRYELSNVLFIKLGWTVLPKDTTMRRVVEFQASPAKPHMSWLKRNRFQGTRYYPDEKTIFMNFLEDGSGHVYYPNGETAVAAHISKKGTHELYKVYAPGGRDIMGVMRRPWLLGVFDSMGNGEVYDEDCNIRLTYNQNGGIYADNPAKVPFSWGWNNFQTFPIDEAVYEDPPAVQLPPDLMSAREAVNISGKASKQSRSSKVMSSGKLSEDQAVLESQKSKLAEPVKVIPRKVITPLKPICLKMNKYLSLRILDRKNINLQFFAGSKCVRVELGTEVDPNVQINSELVDRDDWTAKMTKSRFHVDVNDSKMNPPSPDNSLLEIAEEIEQAKIEASSRRLMIAKYRPHLISSSSHLSPI